MSESPSGMPSLAGGGGIGGLGSLAQAAREKHLRTARGVFIFIGLLTIAVNVFQLASAEFLVEGAIKELLKQENLTEAEADPHQLALARESILRTLQLFGYGTIGLGVVYLLLAAFLKRHPVAICVTGLVLYVAAAVVFGLLDPATLLQGLIVKIVIVIALVKATQAAVAYQKGADPRSGNALTDARHVQPPG